MVDSGPRRRKIAIPDQPEYGAYDTSDAQPPTWDEVETWLREASEFWLVALRPGGAPHVVAIWGIWSDGSVWFVMSPATWTARHLAHDARASAHLPDPREAVVLEGRVDRPDPEAVPAAVVERYEATHGWHQDPTDQLMPFFALRAATVRAWRSVDVRATATRWDLPG